MATQPKITGVTPITATLTEVQAGPISLTFTGTNFMTPGGFLTVQLVLNGVATGYQQELSQTNSFDLSIETQAGTYTFLSADNFEMTGALPSADGVTFTITEDGPAPDPSCLLSTSSILTPNGYKSITDLKAGDQVVSVVTNSAVNVLHCGYNVVDLETLESTNLPLCIPKNHFVESMPNKDVLLSGHHSVVFNLPESNNYVGVQAFKLHDFVKLDKTDVLKATGLDEVRYYHVVVEGGKNAVKCDGLPVETLAIEELNGSFVENV